MKRHTLLIFILYFITLQGSYSQTNLVKYWDKTFGGNQEDEFHDMQQTTDGGYILGGFSNSGISGNKGQASKGQTDYWVVKLDAIGNKEWDKSIGGSFFDNLSSIQQTSDGGYMLGGSSSSGSNWDKSQPSKGAMDYWVVKLDATGKKLWDKTFGGDSADYLASICQTSDGGYILGGSSYSGISSDKSEPNKGIGTDYWILKLDANGNKVWDKTIGGSKKEQLYKILQTSDGGYILGGSSISSISQDKSESNRGDSDYWIVKLDSNGSKQWDRTFGGNATDNLSSILQTSDGGFLLGGPAATGINQDKTSIKGVTDYWVIKLDKNGTKIWDKSFGGVRSSHNLLMSLIHTSDGGYLLGGYSNSGIGGDKSENFRGEPDYWIVKIDDQGNKLWDKTIGGNNINTLLSVIQTTDGNYVLGGYSNSGISGDKSQASQGNIDYCVVKLPAPCSELTAKLTATCTNNGTNIKVNVSDIQPAISVNQAWTLTYTENGVKKTISSSMPSYEIAQNVAPGTVYSLVSIVSGTCTFSLNQTITIQPIPAAPVVTSGDECGANAVSLSATGAPVGGNYVWYDVPLGGKPIYTNPSGSFSIQELNSLATYYVAATNNIGCEGPRREIVVTPKPCPPPFIPNIITQNHDGKNDTFQPKNLPEGNWQLQLYNRWGSKIYETENYRNNWPETKTATGVYYYLLKNLKTSRQFKGWLEVTE